MNPFVLEHQILEDSRKIIDSLLQHYYAGRRAAIPLEEYDAALGCVLSRLSAPDKAKSQLEKDYERKGWLVTRSEKDGKPCIEFLNASIRRDENPAWVQYILTQAGWMVSQEMRDGQSTLVMRRKREREDALPVVTVAIPGDSAIKKSK